MPSNTFIVGAGQAYTTIQAAIDAANAAGGGTVVVQAGTYSETDTISSASNLTIEATPSGVTLAGSIGIIDSSNVTISGLTFQGDGTSVAISSTGGSGLLVSNNIFSGTGQAVVLDGTSASTISGNLIENTKLSAIEEFGGANGNTITNNIITGDNAADTEGAIWLHGANSGIISNNAISDTTGAAISLTDFDGPGTTDTQNNNTVISGNSLTNVDTLSTDSGAIYVLGRSQDPNTGITVQDNYIGAIGTTTAASPHAVGIYLDDNASGVTVSGNIVQASAGLTDPFEIHGGSNDTISGNIFDLGTGSPDFGLFQSDASDQQPVGTFQQLQNDLVTGNIIVTESTAPHDPGFGDLTGGVGDITITGNDFWSYAGAPLNVQGVGPTGDTQASYNPPAAEAVQSLSDYASWSGDGIGFQAIDIDTIGVVSCFCPGTLIATPAGEVAVEDLRAGDLVVSLGGGARPVQWVGRCHVRAADSRQKPVRIRAGSLGGGLPRRDLLMSQGHSVFAEGALIPAGDLVDGEAIAVVPVAEVTYLHILLATHDVILAEGLPCETLLDLDTLEQFENVPPDVQALEWLTPFAPVLRQGPVVERVRRLVLASVPA